jgi:amidase
MAFPFREAGCQSPSSLWFVSVEGTSKLPGFAEYARFDAVGLSELVRTRQASAAELVEEAILRIERVNPSLNAVVERLYEAARQEAGRVSVGPLQGVPFATKNLLAAVQGVPLTGGSRFFKSFVPDHDSELVSRYRRAGLVLCATTNAPELGLLPVTEPELHGPTRNPWNVAHTSGGSSGGAAALVAAGALPMAHANDGGGSIRIPSACCGVFGLKPSRGRMPVGPDRLEVWFGCEVDHVVSRSVRDSAVALDATCGPDALAIHRAPPPVRPFLEEVRTAPGRLRVAFSARPHMPSHVHPDCVRALGDAATLCQGLGHQVEEAHLELDARALAKAFFTVVVSEAAADLVEAGRLLGRKPTSAEFETQTWLVAMLAKQATAQELSLALRHLQNVSRQVAAFFERFDVLLTPTLGQPPPLLGALQPKGAEAVVQRLAARWSSALMLRLGGGIEGAVDRVFDFIPFTPLANFTGQPAMSLPLFWNAEGLPVGVQAIGRPYDEATLFRLAAQLEAARPWAARRPAVSAD